MSDAWKNDARTSGCGIRSVSLEVPRGGFVAIVGPSGSGKPSLLAIAGALAALDSGVVSDR